MELERCGLSLGPAGDDEMRVLMSCHMLHIKVLRVCALYLQLFGKNYGKYILLEIIIYYLYIYRKYLS